MTPTEFKAYPFRQQGDPSALQERIKRAVTSFYRSQSRLPTHLRTNPLQVAEAQEALTALGLAAEVSGNGGTLMGEVELG